MATDIPIGRLIRSDASARKSKEPATPGSAIHEQINGLGEAVSAKLTQITELDLYNNQLTELPKGLEKLTQLRMLLLHENKLTDVKGLEKLTQLEVLDFDNNPDLTKAQIDQLQKALPKCRISSNPKK